jgi:hypothetical protein
MDVGDDYLLDALEVEAAFYQRIVHGGKRFIRVPAGINEEEAFFVLDEIGVDMVKVGLLHRDGQFQPVYAGENFNHLVFSLFYTTVMFYYALIYLVIASHPSVLLTTPERGAAISIIVSGQ